MKICQTLSFLTGSLFLFSPEAIAAELTEPHLNIIPRTAQESTRVARVTAPAAEFTGAERYEANSAGAATVPARKDDAAFAQPSATLEFAEKLDFHAGNGLFRKLWVSSPSSTQASDGLGPLYNARSCESCHVRDGRGHAPEEGTERPVSFLMRLSVPGGPDHGIAGYHATRPHPAYGRQLQDLALAGIPPEYRLQVTYAERQVELADGTIVTLRKPEYDLSDPRYGAFGADTMFSPRIAPQMIGLGLLEAIPAADILALADPGDTDGDGISGRMNMVWSAEFNRAMPGRFGLKAGMPTVREQSAAAFSGDIGISTPLFPAPWGDCTELQQACRKAPHGDDDVRGGFEVDAGGLDLITFYSRNLAVPARRDVASLQVLRGKQVFYETGCTACHAPKFVTHRLADRPEHSFQLIWPYTDLLLHDMGPDLADNRPEAVADGREWRTAPLWGIGLTRQVSGGESYLHDGRARTLLEAILWHGGEAQAARDRVVTLPTDDRNALLTFLGSL
jgi:CxxC motif-containing protein (DUF1111 family)